MTDRYMNTFMSHLNRNKMGSTFARLVTSSLDRQNFTNKRSEQTQSAKRETANRSKTENKKVLKTQYEGESQRDVIMASFRVKDGSLGDSVRILDSPRLQRGKSYHDPSKLLGLSPRKSQCKRQMQGSARERNATKFNSLFLNKKQLILHQLMNRRPQFFKLNKIGQILATLTGNQNVINLRIYKEPLRKFYINRYVKEKITTFFNYEYIQDYDSQLRVLESLLALKLDQIHYLCFLVLDQNSDGLLCNNDLFNMATASGKQNPLISQDVYKIFQYVNYYRKLSPNITTNDSVSEPEAFKVENSNIQKYRLFEAKKEKDKERTRRCAFDSSQRTNIKKSSIMLEPRTTNKEVTKKILSRKTNKHLFSLRHQEEEGQAAMKALRRKFAQTPLQTRNLSFRINFNTFKTIFNNAVPQTYFDLLFVQGGIQLPSKKYMPLDFNIQQSQKKTVSMTQNVLSDFLIKIFDMRMTFKNNKIEKPANQSVIWKSLHL